VWCEDGKAIAYDTLVDAEKAWMMASTFTSDYKRKDLCILIEVKSLSGYKCHYTLPLE